MEGFLTYLSWVVLQRLPLAVRRSYRWVYGCRWLVSSITQPVRVFTVLSSGGQSTHEFRVRAIQKYGVLWGSEGAIEAVLYGVLYRKTEIYRAVDR